MLFLTPLPPFSSIYPLVKPFLTAPNATCSTLLFSVTFPLRSLSVRNTGGDLCSPGIGVLRLERAGAARPLPSQPQGWSCCTSGGSPQVSIGSGTTVLWSFTPPFSHLCTPCAQGFVILATLSLSLISLLFSATSFISRLPFLAHDCWKHYSIPIKTESLTNHKLCL